MGFMLRSINKKYYSDGNSRGSLWNSHATKEDITYEQGYTCVYNFDDPNNNMFKNTLIDFINFHFKSNFDNFSDLVNIYDCHGETAIKTRELFDFNDKNKIIDEYTKTQWIDGRCDAVYIIERIFVVKIDNKSVEHKFIMDCLNIKNQLKELNFTERKIWSMLGGYNEWD